MDSLIKEAAMNHSIHSSHPDDSQARPASYSPLRRTRHLRNACLAYGAIVFASVAAAAAVVTDTVPLMVGGL